MHPLVYYAIVEFERDEVLRRVELERQRRDLQERQQLEKSGLRVGHGRVARVRPTVLARLATALRGSTATPARLGTASRSGAALLRSTTAGRPSDATPTIGCRA